MAELTKTNNSEHSNLSTILRRGAIIGIITAGAIIATPPNKTTIKKAHDLTAQHLTVVHKENSESLSSSFDGVCVLGFITMGITFELYRLGRKLDKMDH